MKKLILYLKNALVTILILFVLYVFVGSVIETMPKNAEVMVDDGLKIYYSPMYFYDNRTKARLDLRRAAYSDIKGKGYRPDEKCRDLGYFTNDLGSPAWEWLDSAGIWKQKHRWNPDGSWNW